MLTFRYVISPPGGWTLRSRDSFSGVVLLFRDRNGHQLTLFVGVDQSSNIPLLSSPQSLSFLGSLLSDSDSDKAEAVTVRLGYVDGMSLYIRHMPYHDRSRYYVVRFRGLNKDPYSICISKE